MCFFTLLFSFVGWLQMIDVTITIAGLHDRTACDLLEFLRCYCKCFRSFGFKTDDWRLLQRWSTKNSNMQIIGCLLLGVLILVWSESGFYLKRLVLLYEWRTITTSKLDRFPYLVFEHNTVMIYFYPRDLGSVQSGCVVFLFESSIFDRLNN